MGSAEIPGHLGSAEAALGQRWALGAVGHSGAASPHTLPLPGSCFLLECVGPGAVPQLHLL